MSCIRFNGEHSASILNRNKIVENCVSHLNQLQHGLMKLTFGLRGFTGQTTTDVTVVIELL